ncbi:MAG TPA: hypothetical protein VF700_02535, partial [Segetibacter sp.]
FQVLCFVHQHDIPMIHAVQGTAIKIKRNLCPSSNLCRKIPNIIRLLHLHPKLLQSVTYVGNVQKNQKGFA